MLFWGIVPIKCKVWVKPSLEFWHIGEFVSANGKVRQQWDVQQQHADSKIRCDDNDVPDNGALNTPIDKQVPESFRPSHINDNNQGCECDGRYSDNLSYPDKRGTP